MNDLLTKLAAEYLAKLRDGKLEPAEQLMAATVFEKLLVVQEVEREESP